MGIVQKAGQLFVEGHEAFVGGRSAQRDAQEGWSVTARPYRPKPSDEALKALCQTTDCTQPTCFLAGNRVLMADGSRKNIEDVLVGDLLMTMSGPDRVRALERPVLGMTRKVIELHGLGDECLFMSDEHPLWVSRRAADGTVSQSWGTYNLNHLLFEMRNSIEPRLATPPIPLNIDLPEQLAHVSGWVHARPIYHHMDPSTQLYNIATEQSCGIFVEGFAAFSHCLGALLPAKPWQGLSKDLAASLFVQQVSTACA
ncbi:hypothetical protein [Variovorax paradoxus]|uniref:hypothetical protein n=1 Tax=Variovorax paradoxus TaxID=34073 RepID=UPI00277E461B|nr:hypothetical protein [Variovorax paradoxus]MDP9933602.1 hypothetical protein [Variovorax paradoxus]